ncbi:hypothetical protein XM47_07560 [Catenovulum maritimum]|uniref:Diguanylate cyclase n=1 Tax=Catenovulum maritimum TaxID=1513271 RepID=A0A0J8GSD3_9ALTE|nr:hypothetical protein XM47_07560 [Catenovulum maritimum]
MSLLIIDDDEVDQLSIIRALNSAAQNFTISKASSATEAMEKIDQTSFDIILLDYRLPDLNGIELLKKIRQSSTDHKAIVMLTGVENAKLERHALEAGAQEFLLKNEVTAKRLLRLVEQAQHRYELEVKLKQSREALKQLAEKDNLTGVANRYFLEETLNNAVARAERGSGKLAVLLLDLDNFKEVNDTLGHSAGDALLVEVSRRLGQVVRNSDFLARFGGDEFVILIEDKDANLRYMQLIERIYQSLSQPIVLGGNQFKISTSIGAAVYGTCANNAEDLLKCADIAMYRAKHLGKNQSQFYTDTLHEEVIKKGKIEHDLSQAIERNQLELYYQPLLRPANLSLGKIEALLRWNHPDLGVLQPKAFLPLAEELGYMCEIGNWVIENTCKQIKHWLEQPQLNQNRFTISVNLSAIQLQDDSFINFVEAAIKHYQIPANCLEFEITEHTLIGAPESAGVLLSKLSNLNVYIALDDFGTGFSSFDHLRLFPIDVMKIDSTFLVGVGENEKAEKLLSAIVQLAKTLELEVVVEGIETEAQAKFCSQLPIDYYQGFHFYEPLSLDKFLEIQWGK